MLHAVGMTKGPSTSVMTEAEEEASHEEMFKNEESEPEQEVTINHPHPNTPQPSIILILIHHNQSTLICICHTPKVKKWTGQSMMHYTIDFSNGNSSARTFQSVSSQPSLNARSARKLLLGLVTFGMDQYVSWGLSKDEMNLDTILDQFSSRK